MRDADLVARAAADADVIFHLAAQVAVTDVGHATRANDFEINALGTLNVLEGARLSGRAAARRLHLDEQGLRRARGRRGRGARRRATSCRRSRTACPRRARVDFHSPYGCSKGAADLYTIDYARIYGIPTVVFRQSCIYGPWQYGNEDQGWIAHFLIRALRGEPITLYGDGRQVRDVLFVDDLLELYDAVGRAARRRSAGAPTTSAAGPALTVSLLEFLDHLREAEGLDVEVSHGEWRPGDQRVYVSDIRRAATSSAGPDDELRGRHEGRLRGWLETTAG